ncbi:hypothetical protein FSZ31_07695 [Sphingorhabdus soli]|uniref:DUF885 domain-containing protein n=1 Tax=Flavisphingopyxis soli TaxID=2601267 RepID=A0A5C6U749_9SPHN|nr:hypothetical protein [Sphingorhabdus soli]TXC68843.1 hypothetical protein FSZ31_07695 [Sphingorhabdus soli]
MTRISSIPKPATLAAALAAALSLAACHQAPSNETSSAPQVSQARDIVPSTPGNGAKATLLAGAEPFENLTELAFSPSTDRLDSALDAAKAMAPKVRPLLSPKGQSDLDRNLTAIEVAHGAQEPADLAIASVEIYRTLVTEAAGASPVPSEVSLLDYAGFRYTADLKARPMRWDDMAAAVDFARSQWDVVQPRVADPETAGKVSAAIDGMSSAVTDRDAKSAAENVAAELDLVDVLEQQFDHR